MFAFITHQRGKFLFSAVSKLLTFVLSFSLVLGPSAAQAQTIASLNLPVPGTMVGPSQAFVPVLLKGMTIHPDNPLQFDFIIDSGNTNFTQDQIKDESQRLVKYFLASMTIPKDDLWVNLSPYEKDRIIPDELGKTELGRDMLAQDYILKQLTASLMYPEKELGKAFWDKVYKQAKEKYGTTEIPVDTFNKVWILPETATVYEHGQTVYIVEAKLKVMLDQDYVAGNVGAPLVGARARDKAGTSPAPTAGNNISTSIIREIILPAIEHEVNYGQNFAPLRQIYHSLILAKWYKETIKNSLLSKIYIDQKKIAGVNIDDATLKDQIYAQYMDAYKKGVFNYIKEDYDQLSAQPIPRKYFSGGIDRLMNFETITLNRVTNPNVVESGRVGKNFNLALGITPQKQGASSPITYTKAKELIQAKLDFENHYLIGLKNIFDVMYLFPYDFDVVYHEEKGHNDSLSEESAWVVDEPAYIEIVERRDKRISQSSSPVKEDDGNGKGQIAFNPLSALKDPAVRDVFRQIIERRYDVRILSEKYNLGDVPHSYTYKGERLSLDEFINKIMAFLLERTDGDKNPHQISQEFRQEFSNMARPPELDEIFDKYMKIKLKEFDLEVLRDALPKGGYIADIGAGKNRLGAQILTHSDEQGLDIKAMIGTDLNDWLDREEKKDVRLAFFKQKSSTRFPLPANSLDAVIVKWVLHHMSYEDQEKFLQNIKGVLKPGGRVIIFESLGATYDEEEIWNAFQEETKNQNTWPTGSYYAANLKLTQDFAHLNADQQRLAHALEDYFGHNLVMGRDFMPQPFTYRSTGDIKKLFENVVSGFTENTTLRRVYGSLPIMRMGPPSIRLVFEKNETTPRITTGDGGENQAMILITGLQENEKQHVKNITSILVYQDRLRTELEQERLDDIVILGNERLDTFAEALDLLEGGMGQRIVILGRFGDATLPLLNNAISHGYRIEISPGVFISNKQQWQAIKDGLNSDNRNTLFKNNEADIIQQILEQIIRENSNRYKNVIQMIKTHGLKKIILTEGGAIPTRKLLINYRNILDNEGAFERLGGHRIVFLQSPHQQLRAKAAFEELFAVELRTHKVTTVSHTVSYDNISKEKISAFKDLLREVWRLIIYSDYGKGYINLRGLYPKGIVGIPHSFWESADFLFDSLENPEKQELAREFMFMVAKEGLSVDDILPLVNTSLKAFMENVRNVARLPNLSDQSSSPVSGDKESKDDHAMYRDEINKTVSLIKRLGEAGDVQAFEFLMEFLVNSHSIAQVEKSVRESVITAIKKIRAPKEQKIEGYINGIEHSLQIDVILDILDALEEMETPKERMIEAYMLVIKRQVYRDWDYRGWVDNGMDEKLVDIVKSLNRLGATKEQQIKGHMAIIEISLQENIVSDSVQSLEQLGATIEQQAESLISLIEVSSDADVIVDSIKKVQAFGYADELMYRIRLMIRYGAIALDMKLNILNKLGIADLRNVTEPDSSAQSSSPITNSTIASEELPGDLRNKYWDEWPLEKLPDSEIFQDLKRLMAEAETSYFRNNLRSLGEILLRVPKAREYFKSRKLTAHLNTNELSNFVLWHTDFRRIVSFEILKGLLDLGIERILASSTDRKYLNQEFLIRDLLGDLYSSRNKEVVLIEVNSLPDFSDKNTTVNPDFETLSDYRRIELLQDGLGGISAMDSFSNGVKNLADFIRSLDARLRSNAQSSPSTGLGAGSEQGRTTSSPVSMNDLLNVPTGLIGALEEDSQILSVYKGGVADISFGDASSPILEILTEHPWLSIAAATAIAAPALYYFWSRFTVSGNLYLLQSWDYDIRRSAAKALGISGDTRAVEPLIQVLKDSNSYVRFAVAVALGKLGDTRAVEPLIQLLKDSDSDVRSAATWALGDLGDTRAVDPLIKLLADGSQHVRGDATKALDKLGATKELMVDGYLKALGSFASDARYEAAKALGRLGATKEQMVTGYLNALGSSDANARYKAAEALGELGDTRAVKPLIARLGDSDSHVRRFAVEALGKLGDPRAIEPLIQMLKDPSFDVSLVAAKAYGKFDKKAMALMHEIDRSLERDGTTDADILKLINGDIVGLQYLLLKLNDKLRHAHSLSDGFWETTEIEINPREENIPTGSQEPHGVFLVTGYELVHLNDGYEERFVENFHKKELIKNYKERIEKVVLIIPSLTSQEARAMINGKPAPDSFTQSSSPVSSDDKVGGIDMNDIDIGRLPAGRQAGVDIQFDPAELQEIIDAGIDGFAPVIINITPLPSVLPLLGLQPAKEEEPLEVSRLN